MIEVVHHDLPALCAAVGARRYPGLTRRQESVDLFRAATREDLAERFLK